jgi:hypothetical protein
LSNIPNAILSISFFVITTYLLLFPQILNGLPFVKYTEKKSELLTQLNRTLKSYKQASNNKLIKEAQQINRYNSEDINVQELRNGNLEETHNLGSIMPGENLTSNQAQSLVSRIYKRDKDFIESTFTFQLRHNDDNTLDIIVNIQD